MKRTIFALGLAAFTTVSLAGTSANLLLKGVVASILEISISPENLASTLPLDRQVNNEKVATITETSNSPTGYRIKVSSAKGGKLVNTSDINSYVSYSLSYNGSNINLSSSASEIYRTSNLKGTATKDLKISYNKPGDLAAGSYEDTVTFTIEAN